MQLNILNNLDKQTEDLTESEERALLSGVVKSVGAMTISKCGLGIEMIFGEHESAIYTSSLLKKLTKKEISLKKNTQSVGKNQITTFTVTVNDEKLREILCYLGILNLSDDDGEAFIQGIPSFVDSVDLFKCYLRGIFISKSKITVPDKDSGGHKDSSSYRLEIRYLPIQACQDICDKLKENFDICLKIKGDGDNATLLSTECDTICDILAFIGASRAVMHINNTRIEKGVKLQAIRETNCEVANITKTVDLSEKLRIAVDELKKENTFTALSKDIQDTCALKIENPEYSLEQIAEILGVSKSAVNHRFRKILIDTKKI